MDTTPFPILNLPSVALRNCLWNMELEHLITFSLCSDRCATAVQSLNITVKTVSFEFGGAIIVTEEHPGCTEFNWPKSDKNSRSIAYYTNHLSRLFIHAHPFQAYLEIEDYKADLFWTIFHEKSIHRLAVGILEVKKKEAEKLIGLFVNQDKVQTERVYLHLRVPKRYKFSGEFIFRNQPNRLKIDYSWWFGFKHLMQCGCSIIELRDSTWSSKKLNKFLKTWKNQENPTLDRLKFLWMTRPSLTIRRRQILKGLDAVHTYFDGELRQFRVAPDIEFEALGFCEIRRDDGTTAIIVMNYDTYPEEGTHSVYFFVP